MSDFRPKRVLILGAGISGLSAAWKLQQLGIQTVILEKKSQAGGLAGTVRQNGFCLDYGPHSFFTEDSEIRQTVLSLFDPPLVATPRQVKFYFRGKYLDYPITAANILFQMGWRSGAQAALSYLKTLLFSSTKTVPNDPGSVETWAIQNFGPYLYKVFFKPYTEQFWEYPCTSLSPRVIPTHTRLSFAKTLRYLLKENSRVPSQLDRESLSTFYPKTGYGEIAELIEAQVKKMGGQILFNTIATRCRRLDSPPWLIEMDRQGSLEEIEADHIISTIPISALVRCLDPALPASVQKAARHLKYRPILMLGMITSRPSILPASYVYTLHRPYNRITEMNKFSPDTSPPGKNILAVEIPCHSDSVDFFQTAEELFERCIPSLEADGLLQAREVEGLLVAKAAEAYPVYLKNYEPALKTLENYVVSAPGLSLLGRTGEFRYMDADQCIRRAFDLSHLIFERFRKEYQVEILSPAS